MRHFLFAAVVLLAGGAVATAVAQQPKAKGKAPEPQPAAKGKAPEAQW